VAYVTALFAGALGLALTLRRVAVLT
jgi:hypothetical protein